jgi:23S rRNA (cytosine1962-C5)-methyltransferase
MYPKLRLRRNADRRLASGHLWVFSNELEEIPKLEAGSLVELVRSDSRSYGLGFYNPASLISIRLLSTSEFDDSLFFYDRIRKALEFRNLVLPGKDIYRLVFGESDFLPGLIIDKYGDYFAVQYLSAGMDKRSDTVVSSLLKLFPDTKGIIAKNTSALRQLEGLPSGESILYGTIPDIIETEENGIKLNISLEGSQKTGYFLDQSLNRLFVRSISHGKRVLDCFCNQGGFALNAAFSGAEYTLGIDSSAQAVEMATNNARLNKFNDINFKIADVFDFLGKSENDGDKWDIIILDPPSFTKSKKTVPTAKKGYEKLNRLALRLLEPGGILATASCSQHIREDVFLDIVQSQAARLGRQLRMIFRGMQAPDHPVLSSMPETQYLKFYAFEVE